MSDGLTHWLPARKVAQACERGLRHIERQRARMLLYSKRTRDLFRCDDADQFMFVKFQAEDWAELDPDFLVQLPPELYELVKPYYRRQRWKTYSSSLRAFISRLGFFWRLTFSRGTKSRNGTAVSESLVSRLPEKPYLSSSLDRQSVASFTDYRF